MHRVHRRGWFSDLLKKLGEFSDVLSPVMSVLDAGSTDFSSPIISSMPGRHHELLVNRLSADFALSLQSSRYTFLQLSPPVFALLCSGVVSRVYTGFGCYVAFPLARLRTSTHPLLVERGRYSGIPRCERLCVFGCGLLEDEVHALIYCREHAVRRERLKKDLLLLGSSWGAFSLYQRCCLLLDPGAKFCNVVGVYVGDVLKCYWDWL